MSRTALRLAALAGTTAAVMTLAASTAYAGADQYDPCHKGNIVCAPINADLSGLDLDVLNILNGHGHHHR